MLLVARWASASSPTTGDELTLTSLLPTASGKYLTLKYKYKYSGHKYEYEYKYFETVLEYYSSARVLLEYKYKYQVLHLWYLAEVCWLFAGVEAWDGFTHCHVQLCIMVTSGACSIAIRYDTIVEFNVDSKAEYTA